MVVTGELSCADYPVEGPLGWGDFNARRVDQMKRYGLASVLSMLSVLFVFGAAVPAGAQYGEDPPEVSIVGTGVASADGKFLARYTAPPTIAEAYLIYVVGTDKDGEAFEFVLAEVTPSFAGLTWSLNGFDMQPGSEFTLEARHERGTDVGAQLLGIESLPITGGDSRGIVGIGLVLAVIGAAMLYGSRIDRSSTVPA